jgi:hypothetical protein
MNVPDNFSESLETVFGLKLLKFFDADPDPGSRIKDLVYRGSGIRNKHPGSATLVNVCVP